MVPLKAQQLIKMKELLVILFLIKLYALRNLFNIEDDIFVEMADTW